MLNDFYFQVLPISPQLIPVPSKPNIYSFLSKRLINHTEFIFPSIHRRDCWSINRKIGQLKRTNTYTSNMYIKHTEFIHVYIYNNVWPHSRRKMQRVNELTERQKETKCVLQNDMAWAHAIATILLQKET